MGEQLLGHLKVLHWNIHSWRDASGAPNVDAVADLIAAVEPHVVSLVEVDERWGAPSILSGLADRHGYHWAFTPAFEYGDPDKPTGGFGNALLTRRPILATQQWSLLRPATVYDGTEPTEPRTAVLARIRTSNGYIWIGSAHLPREDPHARATAMGRLTALAASLDTPWLICGDFNTPASTWTDLPTPVSAPAEPPQPTYPAHRPTEAIDYAVASRHLRIDSQVLPVSGSDHLPVLLLADVP